MKKLLFILLCVPLIGLGQNITYTIFSGVNYALPVGDNFEVLKEEIEDINDIQTNNFPEYKNKIDGGVYGRFGLNFGLGAEYLINEKVSLNTSLFYSEKGFLVKNTIFSESYSDGVPYGCVVIEKNIYLAELDYLDIPLNIKYHINNKFYFEGGFQIDFLVNQSVTYKYLQIPIEESFTNSNLLQYEDFFVGGEVPNDGVSVRNETSYDWDDSLDDSDPTKILMGLQVAIGYNFGKFNLNLKLNKTGNLGEIDNKDGYQNLTLQFSTGYRF